MGLGALVDAAAGVLAVMALFSLAATAMQEAVAQLFNTRGRVLRDGIVALLKAHAPVGLDPARTREYFNTEFYKAAGFDALTHEPVSGVSHAIQRIGLAIQRVEKPLPSAIPPRRYAEALLKLGAKDGRDEAARRAMDAIDIIESRLGGAYTAFSAARGTQDAARAAQDVAAAAEHARRQIADAREVVEARIAHYEREFNEAMDRAKGWYARRARTTLFLIGLLLAMGANIDILSYGERLLTEEAFRTRAAAHADLLGQRLQAQEARDPTQGGEPAAEDDAKRLELNDVEALATELAGLGVQVGWCAAPDPEAPPPLTMLGEAMAAAPICPAGEAVRLPTIRALIGWFIIAFGVTLGAQFWYDLFRKALDLRSSGRVGRTA